jgi:tetraacyldisaccharide 4'-kinase
MNWLYELYFKTINTKNNFNAVNLFLLILSYLYILISKIRLFLYSIKIFKSKTIPAYVISVGNITMGGTGKTPVVIKLAEELSKNYKIGILTRGYKRKNKNPIIVSEKNREQIGVNDIGDEPYMIKQKIFFSILGVGKDRFKLGMDMVNHYEVNLFILDDGFQKLSIKRDLNILLIDALSPFGNGYVFPRGILRETISNIKRADVVILTKTNYADPLVLNELKLNLENNYKKPIVISEYKPEKLIYLHDNKVADLKVLDNKETVLISAIANPESFKSVVERLNIKINKTFFYPDHHSYSADDMKYIVSQVNQENILITEKDQYKILPYLNYFKSKNIYVLVMGTSINFDIHAFLAKTSGF